LYLKEKEDSREGMKREGCCIQGPTAQDPSQYYPLMHHDGFRILLFLITHARTYTRRVSPSQSSLNIRGLSGREIGSGRRYLSVAFIVRLSDLESFQAERTAPKFRRQETSITESIIIFQL